MTVDLGKRKKEYNGLQIYELAEIPNIRATVTFQDEQGKDTHLLFEGTFTIDRTEGSYAYGDELQFCLWSLNPPKIKDHRAKNDGYYRIEICTSYKEGTFQLENALNRVYNAEKERVSSLPEITVTKLSDIML